MHVIRSLKCTPIAKQFQTATQTLELYIRFIFGLWELGTSNCLMWKIALRLSN